MRSALHKDDGAAAWAARVTDVPADLFPPDSCLHGVRHTQRVHVHARRLVRELHSLEADVNVVLTAALWHDIGRVDDGWDPRHGALSVARVRKLGLDVSLSAADARLALFAVRYHCRSDGRGELRAAEQHDPERALRILWLLKDADALDRVRLGNGVYEIDSTALRYDCTVEMIDFAVELLRALP
jgi:HD superfamily phosphodiesterase